MLDAVVVGSGPNGLAAAVTLARSGLGVTVLEAEDTVGGGARTLPLGLADGVVHDVCSAVHPMAWASPFFRAFDLPAHGVELLTPEVSYAQPLDGGRSAVAYRLLDATAERLGPDGAAWRALLGPLAREWEAVAAVALGDKRSVPPGLGRVGALAAVARYGLALLEQGTRAWGVRFDGDEAPALLTGVAAHTITRLPSLAGAGTALLLGALAHASPVSERQWAGAHQASDTKRVPGEVSERQWAGAHQLSDTGFDGGWPLPRGGSGAIVAALVADLEAHGGTVVTGHRVRSRADLPAARAYLFDTTPRTLVDVLGDDLTPALRSALTWFRHGDAAAKVDFVLSGPVPWADPEVGRAGTVHVGGTRADLARAESDVAAGRHPERPVCLVSDPTVVDPSREHGGLRPLWTYAHVPAGSDVDMTEAVTAQVERFAPGFRDVVVTSRCTPAARLAEHDANYVGGDIAAGAVSMWQMIARPTARPDPYAAGGGAYLCSSSTPPGPGVHGMGGWHAARRALRDVFGVRVTPL
ncbi:NAD(P)/FAD-dependent oxidoreductase [Isoptericola variabilis]|uniref:Pyridine nucleotide-disulfide oxidoreductase domain-containing protein 2 n=1 Tax=Isoptericola variabilis (strain 225) TaxID=743718 RepID=F6FV38_ISOV2|nr:NAD(P)/FAD-dependent oxidoreductase [Isoptericola variabilis]AEG45466.1 FAD dependent oxidoreductase [Isoptericola variabilis 225]TWH33847.1 phytoene dehydrogenase-like protein [Isoptericola variabilis J7]